MVSWEWFDGWRNLSIFSLLHAKMVMVRINAQTASTVSLYYHRVVMEALDSRVPLFSDKSCTQGGCWWWFCEVLIHVEELIKSALFYKLLSILYCRNSGGQQTYPQTHAHIHTCTQAYTHAHTQTHTNSSLSLWENRKIPHSEIGLKGTCLAQIPRLSSKRQPNHLVNALQHKVED